MLALTEFFGSDAGLSASTISRLTTSLQAEYREWECRDFPAVDYVHELLSSVAICDTYRRIVLPGASSNRFRSSRRGGDAVVMDATRNEFIARAVAVTGQSSLLECHRG